jgi:predicted kinase
MVFVVLMNGTCVSFKTVFSLKLSRALGLPLIASYFFGRSATKNNLGIDRNARNKRHDLFFQEAERLIALKKSVVLDGASSRKRFRERLYEILNRHGVKDVVIVRTVCFDMDVVKLRLEARSLLKKQVKGSNGTFMDLNFHHKENYFGSLFHEDTPFEDTVSKNVEPSVIYFDSVKLKVISVLNPTKRSALVQKTLVNAAKTIVPDNVFLENLKRNKPKGGE